MTERVQVDPSEIKIGDLIEVETPEGMSGATLIRRDVVTGVEGGNVTTTAYKFSRYYDKHTNRVYYRLAKPAPEEPKGLGAVVELDVAGDQKYTLVRIHDEEYAWMFEDGDQETWNGLRNSGTVKVLSDGYTAA